MPAADGPCGFALHPAARLWLGVREVRLPQAQGGVVAAEPAEAALAAAMSGQPFRIGASGALQAGPGAFETLTSGSSGAPRRILRSVASWQASFAVNAGLFGIGPGTVVAVLGGLEQSLALYAAVEGLSLGAGVRLLAGLRPDRQLRGLAGCHCLYATPAQLRLLVQAAQGPVAGLGWVIVGGSKLDARLRADLAALFPDARLREFYGAAEASFVALAGEGCPEGAVGRAYPGVELQIDAPEGEVGEIWMRSPYLFKTYAGPAAPGSARWREGWLSVGEMGRIVDGWLWLAGRAGRMVTVADQNVFPEEIETFLMEQPGVLRAAILPVPDALRGHRLVALVQGVGEKEALLAALRARLGPTIAPRHLEWRQDWPVLPSGKTDFRALAAGLSEGASPEDRKVGR